MKNRCVISLLLVTAISLLSVVAFAFSFTGTPAEENEKNNVITPDEDSEERMTTSVAATERVSVNPETETVKRSKIPSMDWDEDEAYMLAKIAMAEAEGEDTEGKALVILVVLNRVWSDEFPDTIEEVITQKKQFAAYENGRYDRVEPDKDCYRALELVQIEKWDESQGAVYFENKSDFTWHSKNLKFLFNHGRHYFYRDEE